MNLTTTFYSATTSLLFSFFTLRENLESKSLFTCSNGMEWTVQSPTNERRYWTTNFNPSSLIMYFLFLRICYTCSCMFFLFHSLSLSLSLFLHWQKIFQINWRCIIQAGVAGSEMFRRWNFVEKPNKNEAKEKSQKEKIQRGKHFRGEIIVHKKTIIGGEFS